MKGYVLFFLFRLIWGIIVKTPVWTDSIKGHHNSVVNNPVITLVADTLICEWSSVVAPFVLTLTMT